ncbi:corticosteroid-binding globulin [Equus asinus]|uniref:Corticosteroid-binding globulin n=1 Tax=Equus asinus TaxID=9793 RepID=A0A8C4N2N6_EQUAS|nr:corticosteroid-binding globulin [Equus asinus]XP_046503042.1 corticosteroid-binding globulin [Equus quagga]
MLLGLSTCLLWLSTSGLWTIQAEDPDGDMSIRIPHRDLAPSNVDFAFSLYKHLVVSAPGRDVFISPVSISTALAMLSLGTRGHTQIRLLQGLGFNLTEMSEARIHQGFQHLHHVLVESETTSDILMGNALFFDHSLELLESFSADTERYYELEALATDFQDQAIASRQINEYLKNKTQGKIADLFLELDSPATLILVNYIFFKGAWAQPFNPESTREEDFYVNETTVVKVPMMSQSSTMNYLNDPVLSCQLVQLDYTSNGTVFFILPEKGKIDIVIDALSRSTLGRWEMSLTRSHVDLHVPKLFLSSTYDLGDILRDRGIADFSGISQEGRLKVVHKAALHLDEKGEESAAPTGIPPNVGSKPLTIRFNRPFIILVFDHFTWSSLFLVKVVNPAEGRAPRSHPAV